MAEDSSGTNTPTPGFVLPGLRCGVEMALVGTIVLLIGLPTEEPYGWESSSSRRGGNDSGRRAIGRHSGADRYAQGSPTRTTPLTGSGDRPGYM
ncbi:hypothetical protein C9J85_01565 [Haloferax sp. wsp5]|nr:hypothetical protein C9J85_01565 [Haloferax sp. wsp5]